jgi:hypothetical protein
VIEESKGLVQYGIINYLYGFDGYRLAYSKADPIDTLGEFSDDGVVWDIGNQTTGETGHVLAIHREKLPPYIERVWLKTTTIEDGVAYYYLELNSTEPIPIRLALPGKYPITNRWNILYTPTAVNSGFDWTFRCFFRDAVAGTHRMIYSTNGYTWLLHATVFDKLHAAVRGRDALFVKKDECAIIDAFFAVTAVKKVYHISSPDGVTWSQPELVYAPCTPLETALDYPIVLYKVNSTTDMQLWAFGAGAAAETHYLAYLPLTYAITTTWEEQIETTFVEETVVSPHLTGTGLVVFISVMSSVMAVVVLIVVIRIVFYVSRTKKTRMTKVRWQK